LKKAFTQKYRGSKTFKAPLDFVFAWCTDYREDDVKMTGSKSRRTMLEKTPHRVVWVVTYKQEGKTREGLRVVWPHPPDAWELDTCGDMADWGERERGWYKLTPKGNNRTRLDMEFVLTYNSKRHFPEKKQWLKELDELWDTLASFLEKDYKESLRKVEAKGLTTGRQAPRATRGP